MLNSMGRRATKQLGFELKYRGRGGYRPGAGRPKKPGAGVPHVRRSALKARHPVHVTARVRDGHRQLVAQPRTWLLRIGWTLGLPGQ